jgi:hypothetical protein
MKVCTKCNRTLPVDQFSRNGKWLRSRCRDCCKQYRKDRLANLPVNAPPKSKWCRRCEQNLPASKFSKKRDDSTGLSSYCKPCQSAVGKERSSALTVSLPVEKACTKCRLVLASSLFANNTSSKDGLHSWCRECTRLYQIQRIYNIAPEEYLGMAKGGCHICGAHDRLVVDHDHSCCPGTKSCGKCVRGVLCSNHTADLMAAAEYLKHH